MRVRNKMIEEIGIDSIYGYGKTNKLDVYITYNFSNLSGDSETLQWTSEVRVWPLEINSNIYPR
jgi:hypothetical protein